MKTAQDLDGDLVALAARDGTDLASICSDFTAIEIYLLLKLGGPSKDSQHTISVQRDWRCLGIARTSRITSALGLQYCASKRPTGQTCLFWVLDLTAKECYCSSRKSVMR